MMIDLQKCLLTLSSANCTLSEATLYPQSKTRLDQSRECIHMSDLGLSYCNMILIPLVNTDIDISRSFSSLVKVMNQTCVYALFTTQ